MAPSCPTMNTLDVAAFDSMGCCLVTKAGKATLTVESVAVLSFFLNMKNQDKRGLGGTLPPFALNYSQHKESRLVPIQTGHILRLLLGGSP